MVWMGLLVFIGYLVGKGLRTNKIWITFIGVCLFSLWGISLVPVIVSSINTAKVLIATVPNYPYSGLLDNLSYIWLLVTPGLLWVGFWKGYHGKWIGRSKKDARISDKQ